MTEEKRSPLKELPLRLPGESLDEQRRNLVDDELILPALFALFVLVLATLEWGRYALHLPPFPKLYTAIALVVCAVCGRRIVKVWPRLRDMQLGSRGEKVVGQMLEQFRADGFKVFHDIPGNGFNIDHVLVGPQGTFTIETKTISKPPSGSVEVLFDGEKITVNGWTPERDPVVQAQAESKWLHDMLQNTTGRSFWVQPVVVYPGWYVRETAQETRVWVLNPDRLRKKIQSQPIHLKLEDIALIADRIQLYVRGSEKR